VVRRVRWRRSYTTITVVSFWLVMMGILVKREVLVPHLPPANSVHSEEAGAGVRPTDSWMGVYFSDGTKIGYTHSVVRPRPESIGGGYKARNVTRIKMSLLGHPVEIDANVNWTLDGSGRIADLRFTLDSSDSLFTAVGKVEDGVLRLKVSTGQAESTSELPIGDNLLVSSTLSPVMTLPDLEEGVEYTFEMLDPLTLTTRKAKLKVVAEESIELAGKSVDTRHIEVDFAGFVTDVWVTDDGEIGKVETPIGLIMVKELPEQAISGASGATLPDFASAAAIASGRIVERPQDIKRMIVRFDGINPKTFPVWNGSQRILDEKKSLIEVSTVVPNADQAPRLPISESDLAEFVEPGPFVQSDDPRVVEAAREIVGDETDSWRAALKLLHWVDTEIDNEAVASVPSAVDVLHARKGDCNEHTVLYVALARAVGLPAKTDVGLVYYKDGLFCYHAWPEVHVGEWVRVDPTLGQEVADATHIKLTEGELYRWTDILPTIKKLKLEIIDVDYGVDG